jgi:hypothetical protein
MRFALEEFGGNGGGEGTDEKTAGVIRSGAPKNWVVGHFNVEQKVGFNRSTHLPLKSVLSCRHLVTLSGHKSLKQAE